MEDFLTILKDTCPMDELTMLRMLNEHSDRQVVRKHLQDVSTPHWLQIAAASLLMELWRQERSTCTSVQLLEVDRKYSRIFRRYTVAEVIEWIKKN